MSSSTGRPEVVVVTGAGAGLGRAIVQSFARRGAHIGLVARSHERLDDARREVESLGGKALVLPGDVADPATTSRAADQTEQAFGPLDVWVNDAMTTVFSPFHQMSADDFRRVTEVTYLGFVYGTMAALQHMRPRNEGTIVQVGSALAYRSIPLQSAYCGAKHAIVGFTDSIRSELIHDRSAVHITVVQMPALNTPQFSWCKTNMPRKPQPVPPIFQPEVGAEAVYWAAHQRHREVFVGWPTARAIWGQRVVPGLLDHLAARLAWDGQMYDGARAPDRAGGPVSASPGPPGGARRLRQPRADPQLGDRSHDVCELAGDDRLPGGGRGRPGANCWRVGQSPAHWTAGERTATWRIATHPSVTTR